MSANNYVFQEGCFDMYLAKKIKSKTFMSEDRRVVTDNEIIALFEWYLRKWSKENGNGTMAVVRPDGVKIFEAKLLDIKEDEE